MRWPDGSLNVSAANDTLHRRYQLVHDAIDRSTGPCRVNRYDESSSYRDFHTIQNNYRYSSSDESTCATSCDSWGWCRGFHIAGCTDGEPGSSSSPGSCLGQCYRYVTTTKTSHWSPSNGYDITSSGTTVLGSTRCYERRESNIKYKVLLPATFAYAADFDVVVNPWNQAANAGSYGYLASSASTATCAAVSFRPAAPVGAVHTVLDRYANISWTEPGGHGASITDYLYQICLADPSSPTTACSSSYPNDGQNLEDTSWNRATSRYMCAVGSVHSTWCSAGTSAPVTAGTQFRIDGLSSSDTYDDTDPGDGAGLAPGSSYLLLIRARNSNGLGWASARVSFTTAAAPLPAELTEALPRALTVSWPAYSPTSTSDGVAVDYSAGDYRVRLYRGSKVSADSATWITTRIVETSALSYTFEGYGELVPGYDYWVEVAGRIEGHWSGWSSAAVMRTASDVPEVPSTPSLAVGYTRELVVTVANPFANGAPITNLKLLVSPPAAGGENVTVSACSSCTASISGLTPGVHYSIRLVAINEVGESAPSAALEHQTCEERPDQLEAATFSASTTTSITMSWSAPLNDNGAPITNYELRVRNSSTVGLSARTHGLLTGNGSTRSLEVSGLTPGYGYQFSVLAYNGAPRGENALCSDSSLTGWGLESPWTGHWLYTLSTVPEAPEPASLVEAQGKRMSISWTAPYSNGATLTAFTLYMNASACGMLTIDIAQMKMHSCGTTVDVLSTTELILFGLTPHTAYAFVLTANNTAGESPPSPLASFWTDYHEPEMITEIADPPFRGDRFITIDWTPPVDNGLPISLYEIKFRFVDGCSDSVPCIIGADDLSDGPATPGSDGLVLNSDICTPSNVTRQCIVTSYTHNNLSPNREYEYRVRAFNGYVPAFVTTDVSLDGWSDWSPTWITFSTTSDVPLVPPRPSPPALTNLTARTAVFSWAVPDQAELGMTPAVNTCAQSGVTPTP